MTTSRRAFPHRTTPSPTAMGEGGGEGVRTAPSPIAMGEGGGEGVTRRAFLHALTRTAGALAGVGLLGGCALAPAAVPSSARVYRVGLLSGTTESGGPSEASDGEFIARLGELGYREGENLTIERRGLNPGGAAEDENRVTAAELVGLPVDVIVARGGPRVRAAMAATSAVPIVMLTAGTNDPVASGFVESLARPGGNVTGVIGPPPEVDLKRLQLLVEAVPGVSMVAVLGNFGDPQFWEPATRLLGVEVFSATPAGFEGGFEAALVRAVGQGADGLLTQESQGAAPNAALIGGLSARYRLPGIFPSRSYVAAGGLITYESRSSDRERRGADYVDRILRGTRPADLPIESPTRYDLIVNMGTARALGLTISTSFMAQADEVIE